jgi:hypothetical protein
VSNEAVRWLQSVSDRLSCNCLVIRQDHSASSASICCLKEARNALAFIAQRITLNVNYMAHARPQSLHRRSKQVGPRHRPSWIVGVLVFLFFLFFIAGHYLGVLLVFNGDTSCFIGPWCRKVLREDSIW